ncbi:MAG TPA: hybrid sensor histidine kinase/response regulator [Candidatus Kapabacteria bacterium]|nr:hybrid sensor histidine kinase/response regulator [Candidatus Kapabacteria bacterium]
MVKTRKDIDITMLELFRVELDNNAHLLEKGLINLENQANGNNLEPLMRAAHSIKGAARIVGLPKAVELSHAMEDLLEKALKSSYELTNIDIENLLDGNDTFLDLLRYDYTEIPDIIIKNSDNIDNIINNLYFSNESQKISQNIPSTNIANGISEEQKEQPYIIEKSDSFMVELFIKELKDDLLLLEESIVELNETQNPEVLNKVLQSIHSLKGAASIIKMEPINYLNKRLEECILKLIDSKQICSLDFKFIFDLYNEGLKQGIDNIYEFFYSKYGEIKSFINTICVDAKLTISNTNGKANITQNEITPKIATTTTVTDDKLSVRNDTKARKTSDERFVRVFSESLNRILGLSGEVLVQTRLIRPFIVELQKIKREVLEINAMKEEIYQRLFDYAIEDDIKKRFDDSSVKLDRILSLLMAHIQNFDNFSRRVEITADKLYNESISTRMKPFSEGITGFPRMVRDISKQLNKKVELIIKGENTKVDRDILEHLESPLNHLVSNAIDHAIEFVEVRLANNKPEMGKITLEAKHSAGMLMISVSDDGSGINKDSLRAKIMRSKNISEEVVMRYSDSELYDFLFLPGFSTKQQITEISGRGVGLDIVANAISDIGGIIKVSSQLNSGTTFTLQLPLTLSVIRTLLVEIAGQTYAFPISKIERALIVNQNEIYSVDNNEYIIYENMNIGIIKAHQIFNLNPDPTQPISYNIIIISDRLSRYGVVVDRFLGQPDLVLLKLDKKLGRVPNISNGAILEDGSPTLVIDVDDMVRSIEAILKYGKIDKVSENETDIEEIRQKKILVVEDSLTVREVERKLLENRGYHVTVAVDGIDGWNVLHRGDSFDLIISDIDMPRMNGIELVKKIRNEEQFKEIPIMIVSYKDREEDKIKGLEAGANYYLAKSSFHDDTLIEAVEDLIGAV